MRQPWINKVFFFFFFFFFKANIPSINLQARKPNWFFPSELKKWRSRLSENEKDLFLTRTETTKCNNTKNILLDGCYLLFE